MLKRCFPKQWCRKPNCNTCCSRAPSWRLVGIFVRVRFIQSGVIMFRVIILISFFGTSATCADIIKIGTFNTESSSDTQPFKVAEIIRAAGKTDVWALQEVASVDAAIEYTVAAGAVSNRKSFRYVVSESGEISAPHRRNDLLAIVYNSSDLRHVETIELHGIRSDPGTGRLGVSNWRLRGALFLRLQHMDTGIEFYVGNVHLKCCGDAGPSIRAHQAEILRQWIDRSDVPVVLVGDF